MIPIKFIKAFLAAAFFCFGAQAAVEKSLKSSDDKKVKSTDVSFEDVLVQGRYNFSDEAITTVEDDKVLDALLAVRKDFQDRLKKSAEHK